MDITPLISKNKKIVQSYYEGGFKISGQSYSSSLLISPDHVMEWDISFFTHETKIEEFPLSFLKMLDKIDVFILGTGQTQEWPNPDIEEFFTKKDVVIETMMTSVACHTFNVLAFEARPVAAGLISL